MTVFAESLRLALAGLRGNPLRAALTILGILIGIGAVVALTSIGRGAQRSVESRFTAFGTDTITVQSSSFSSSSLLTEADLAAIQKSPGVKRVVYTVETNAGVTAGSTTAMASVVGTSPDFADIDHLTVQAGTFFSAFAAANDLPVAVLGYNVVSNLSLTPVTAVGRSVTIGGRSFQVVGVLEETGGVSFSSADNSVIVPRGSIIGRLVSFHPDISSIRVQAKPGALDTYSAAVETTLRDLHGLTSSEQDDFRIINASSIATAVSSTSATLTKLMAAIAAISLIVGGIGIANVMLVTVRERTREIGVRRAVGATRRDIIAQFLVDAVVISVIGGILGLGAGLGGAFAGGSALGVTPAFSWTTVILAIGVAAVVGVVAGIGPAAQAASVEPTTALRYE
jgi:putative ABC transport system permease protein